MIEQLVEAQPGALQHVAQYLQKLHRKEQKMVLALFIIFQGNKLKHVFCSIGMCNMHNPQHKSMSHVVESDSMC